jgi:VanZ family protein
MKLGHFVRSWVPVIVWMLVIVTASTDLMSAEHTSRFIGPFLRWLLPEISAATILAAQFFIRKAAHVTEYAILAALLWRAMRRSFTASPNKMWAGAAFLLAAVFAISDEFHQSFVASRTGSPHDVMIDASGAILGLTIYWLLFRQSIRTSRIEMSSAE